ncbi:hypothetical protein K439DRAFT_1612807 [Ramaria rubella]|nr:hypothetical protein K439DRAFT_1612807 [Ramaria rubella]
MGSGIGSTLVGNAAPVLLECWSEIEARGSNHTCLNNLGPQYSALFVEGYEPAGLVPTQIANRLVKLLETGLISGITPPTQAHLLVLVQATLKTHTIHNGLTHNHQHQKHLCEVLFKHKHQTVSILQSVSNCRKHRYHMCTGHTLIASTRSSCLPNVHWFLLTASHYHNLFGVPARHATVPSHIKCIPVIRTHGFRYPGPDAALNAGSTS